MAKLFTRVQLIGIATIVKLCSAAHVLADDLPVANVPAKRGMLVLDDDGSKDSGGKTLTCTDRPEIAVGAMNTISLTLGTTWDEIKRVRIWHAEAHREWEANKSAILKLPEPFTARPR